LVSDTGLMVSDTGFRRILPDFFQGKPVSETCDIAILGGC
jgi:hypothetical protein